MESLKELVMLRAMRMFVVAAACAALLMASAPPPRRDNPIEGREWLAWSPAEREIYVSGFLEGYWTGSREACELTDHLFEVGKAHRVGENPQGRCSAHLEHYTKLEYKAGDSVSKPDFSAYTSVMTDFYSKHPEYRNVPKVYILQLLSDRSYKTADQLYRMALKGEMRTHF
jgi:hypothetical protein